MPVIDSEHFIEELIHSIENKDSIKLDLVLSELENLETKTQTSAVFELGRAKGSVVAPSMVKLLVRNSSLLKSVSGMEETFKQQMINHIPSFLDCLSNTRFNKRDILISLAMEMQLEEAVPILIDIAKNSNLESEIKQTVEALGVIGDTDAIATLTELLYSGSREIIIETVKALGRIGGKLALKGLEDRMGSDSGLDLLIISVFAKIQSPLSLDKLCETLSSKHAHIRNYAKSKLVEIGEKAVPLLVGGLVRDDSDWVIHALNVLGDIADGSAVAPIRRLLRSDPENPNVRFAAYEALGLMPIEKGAFALATGLSDPVEHVAIAAAKAIDKNFGPIFQTGLKNIIRSEDHDLEKFIGVIITAEADKIFLSLLTENVFLIKAASYIKTSVPPDERKRYVELLENNGYSKYAEIILETEKKKETTEKTGKKVVWAVDDSRMMLAIYKNALFKLDYEAQLFEFPESLLETIGKDNMPDLLVTDLNMPNISGIELTAKLREKYSDKDLPIIMITTQSDAKQDKVISDAGVNKVLFKPFEDKEFGAVIKEYLDN